MSTIEKPQRKEEVDFEHFSTVSRSAYDVVFWLKQVTERFQ